MLELLHKIESSLIGQCLHIYECASGQKVNLQKSNVVFSSNVSPPSEDALAQLLGVEKLAVHEKYLGLPTANLC